MNEEVKRYKLADLEKDLSNGFNNRKDDLDRLKLYSELLWNEAEQARKKKKMGRLRIYDRYGLQIDSRILELQHQHFNTIPELGIF